MPVREREKISGLLRRVACRQEKCTDGGGADAFALYGLRLKNVDYLVKTTLPASREPDLADDIRSWMNQVQWQKLHVLSTEAGTPSDNEGIVEFIAEFIGPHGAERHHERSLFKKVRGVWFYVG
jgi:uncharacterized protein YchJ